METRDINLPVKVTDNGLRSFIPPCFCFELRDHSNTLVEIVSQVVLEVADRPRLRDFEVLDMLHQNGLSTLGTISDYDAGSEARETGRRFTILQIVQ
jgi:hypothetical protein